MIAKQEELVSRSEYIQAEEVAQIRHEYLAGRVYAMAGASDNHSAICVRLIALLDQRLYGTSCAPRNNDLRIRIEEMDTDLYPDALIFCGLPEFENEKKLVLLNPKVIFEILSPSTEKFDQGEKFDLYAKLPSLTDYVVIAQDRVRVRHFRRQGATWNLNTLISREDYLSFPKIPLQIQMGELYRDLDVPSGLSLLKS